MSFMPPGCRFYPSDQQLLCFYLTGKNQITDGGNDYNDGNNNGYDLIKELDLYDYPPFDLPENTCYAYGRKGRKRHWYCYTKIRVLKSRRRANGGYWRSSGRVRNVVDPNMGKDVVGTRTKFVFYVGNSVKDAKRTEWVLYEYALIHHSTAAYVLCRVFAKPRVGKNGVSENVVSSCAEESVSAVRRVGIQHDGFLTPDIVESKMQYLRPHGDSAADSKKVLSRIPVKLSAKLDYHVSSGGGEVNIELPDGIQLKINSTKLVRPPGLPDNEMLVDGETTQQLVSVLEGDFIELDDLLD